MQRGLKKIALAIVSLGLLWGLILGSVVSAKATEERVVRIGLPSIFTGAVASSTAPMCFGYVDAAKWATEQGGIGGIPVEVVWHEIGKAPMAQIVPAYKKLQMAGVVALVVVATCHGEVLLPRLQRDEMPLFMTDPFTAGCVSEPPWIFGMEPLWSSTFATAVKWFNERWTEPRPMRVAGICYNNPEGLSTFTDGYGTKAIEEMGVDFIGHEVIPMLGTLDSSVEWLRLAGEKADLVFVMAYGSSLNTVIKDCDRLEIQKKGIKVCGSTAVADWAAYSVVGKDLEGWYGVCPISHELLRISPNIKALEEAGVKRGYEPNRLPFFYVGTWHTMMVLCEGIRLAMEKVGYENLTGRPIRNGLETVKGFDSGLNIPPADLTSPHRPYWSAGIWIEQFRDGEFVTVSGKDCIEYIQDLSVVM